MAGATLRDGKGKFETPARVVKNAGDGGAAGDRRERDPLPLGHATGGSAFRGFTARGRRISKGSCRVAS